MPIYVYEPTVYSADEEVKACCFFELLESIHKEPLTNCPTCQHKIHRAITTFNMSVNYFTDYKNQSTQLNMKSANVDHHSSSNISTAGKAARLAARHICSGGCSH